MSDTSDVQFIVVGEARMQDFGARIADLLQSGDLLLLRGDLGAGKTTLTRAITRFLGSAAAVSSPTFALIHVYEGGRFPVVHVDAYRLRSASDMETIGLDDYLRAKDSVIVVEWPERIEDALPGERLEITIEESGDDARKLTISSCGERWKASLSEIHDTLNAEFLKC